METNLSHIHNNYTVSYAFLKNLINLFKYMCSLGESNNINSGIVFLTDIGGI